jgi:hypothetical protein
MRKFIVTLFILLVLAGTIFFFGWAQLPVPPGAYGVARSKTHGVDPRLVRSGEFRWLWYKLIPTNVEIAVFRLEPVSRQLNIQNTLPLGSSYAAFAGFPADFSWELKGSFSFSLNPESLVSLVSEQGISSQEALDAWQRGLAEKIEGLVMSRLNSADMSAGSLEEMLKTGSSPALETEIRRQFPQIADFSFAVTNARFPDLALYRQVRALYEDFVASQRQYVSSELGQKAENHITSQLHFEELERYGELLAKYPVLLEYLALEKGLWNGSAPK